MAKIDRLGWADGMSFISYGVRLGVRVNDPSILKDVIARLPPGSKPATLKVVDQLYSVIGGSANPNAKVRRLNLVYWNLLRIGRSRNFDEVLEALESHVQLTVAEYAPRRVFVHAGVVGWKDRAIIIPGMSHSGKTTLVDRLIRAGATYYSDEFAVLDERGYVHPYPKPLSIRAGCEEKQLRVRVEELGAETGVAALPVGLVLLTQFESAVRWRPRELSYGRGVLGLLSNTPAARMRPDWALKILATSV